MERTDMKVQLISRQDVYELSFQLSLQIIGSGYRPDLVVAIARGGFVPARYLCDFLDLEGLAGFKIKHYGAGAEKEEEAKLEYPLPVDVEGRRVLLVDDVNDTGETLKLAHGHLASRHPEALRTAVLHEKETTVFPSHFRQELLEQWRWITYPWARTEDITEFVRHLDAPAHSLDELRRRLQEKHAMDIRRDQLERLQKLGKFKDMENVLFK